MHWASARIARELAELDMAAMEAPTMEAARVARIQSDLLIIWTTETTKTRPGRALLCVAGWLVTAWWMGRPK
jgi:hypothetical protein